MCRLHWYLIHPHTFGWCLCDFVRYGFQMVYQGSHNSWISWSPPRHVLAFSRSWKRWTYVVLRSAGSCPCPPLVCVRWKRWSFYERCACPSAWSPTVGFFWAETEGGIPQVDAPSLRGQWSSWCLEKKGDKGVREVNRGDRQTWPKFRWFDCDLTVQSVVHGLINWWSWPFSYTVLYILSIVFLNIFSSSFRVSLNELFLPPSAHSVATIPGLHGGHALGHAAQLEANKREKVPQRLSSALMPKSVQEAEELIRSTFGEMAQRSKIKEIAANLRLGFGHIFWRHKIGTINKNHLDKIGVFNV